MIFLFFFFGGGGEFAPFPYHHILCHTHRYGYGWCRRDLSKSGNLKKNKKKKKKNTGINFTKLNILYFDYYNISISFVHWYILNWKYENCYTELCRVQNFCILASTMTLVLKFLIPHTSFIFLWSPLFEPQNDPFLICPPSTHQSIYEHSQKRSYVAKRVLFHYGFVRN